MSISSLFLDIFELELLCGAVSTEAEAGVFGVEANTTTNSMCSALQTESEVVNDYWQLLLIAANAMADYRDLINRDMALVVSAGRNMTALDKSMAVSIATMSANML